MITIDGYAIDGSLSETHAFESEVTEYPVEKGGDVTDNVRPKPIVVEIEGLVSDTPIGNMVAVRQHETASATGDLEFLPSEDALARLLKIREAREPVTIETSLRLYEDMVMTNLDVPRDARTGHALRFTASFQQVVLVSTSRTTVRVRVAVPSAAKKFEAGNAVPTNLKVNGRPVFSFDKKYVDENGKPIPQADVDKAAREAGAVQVRYDKNGHSYPVDPNDYHPYSPKSKHWFNP